MARWYLTLAFALLALSGQTYAADPNTWTWTTLDCPGFSGTTLRGIDGGKIIGSCNGGAFVYDGTTWTMVNYPGASFTWVYGISGDHIVGGFNSTDGSHGFLYDGTTWSTVDLPNGNTTLFPSGVSGDKIVGTYGTHALLYEGTTWTTFDYPGATRTHALGIEGNNIVGYCVYSLETYGFLYDGATWTLFAYPGPQEITFPYDISGNNIVGWHHRNGQKGQGFLYDGLTWTSLIYPGSEVTVAYGISGNDIVGYYADANHKTHGFLLTIPEPATLSVLALGGLSLLARTRRTSHRSGGDR
jgi:hypothetical protein